MNVILKALGNIDEKFIAEADEKLPKFNVKKFILPIVACFMIVVGISAWQFSDYYFGMSSSDDANISSDNEDSDTGGDFAVTDDKDEGKEFSKSTGICIVSGDKYLVLIDNSPVVMTNYTGNENIFDDLQTGDLIEIEYGYVNETYPGETGINSLNLLEKGSVEDVPQDVIDSLNELNWEID